MEPGERVQTLTPIELFDMPHEVHQQSARGCQPDCSTEGTVSIAEGDLKVSLVWAFLTAQNGLNPARLALWSVDRRMTRIRMGLSYF